MNIVNKECPFCKRLMRKDLIGIKKYKIHCFRCKNNFYEVDGDVFFKFSALDIAVYEEKLLINCKNKKFEIFEQFDPYKNINKILDKIKTINIFQ